ncbi:hypothetical protein D3C77_570500 [compost metagenome]
MTENFRKANVNANMMTIPPIVGVPAFFWWLCGPSPRICCPNFIRRRSGMRSGAEMTANIKDTPIVSNISPKSMGSPPFAGIIDVVRCS